MTNIPNRISAESQVVLDFSDFLELVKNVRAQMAQAIGELVSMLEAAAASDADLDFAGLVRASQQLLELDDADLARILNVSRPTVGRWTRGVSSPHPLARKAIFDALARSARGKLKLLRD
ncbi:hypothetical protein [Antarcticirhabdus aurantiaca]|uniref:Uncharacterized protein n=1 Tax=Antarcticirhabdus aurantiaca TaxID=2606717 RepID=A0ACD4NR73_9HYPH|nr:hypothetical protein [Antarcticirhabdus aurantiaca]WAJ29425.1 hypothetical protein OXU80_04090 [Jeongeuplla avenae]